MRVRRRLALPKFSAARYGLPILAVVTWYFSISMLPMVEEALVLRDIPALSAPGVPGTTGTERSVHVL